ncbi:hypothetical protein [Rhizobium sp. BK251]|uniref:hypothetical protein n=1 Tax=Rhizobium sp. BK251 TaxID=2512125 RepID=UPI00104FB28B|nr:hypothetical protein [Rhizobium sp. BK251]
MLEAFISASRPEGNPALQGSWPTALDGANGSPLFSISKKWLIYKGLNKNVVNRNILPECSKNAKKADDKAHSLS